MSEKKMMQSMDSLGKALDRLEEAVEQPTENQLMIDGAIQRFEFTIELYWKTLKRLLETEGIQAMTPRDTIKQAYHIHWLDNEKAWLQMLKDRNQTSHTYDETLASEIYEHIKGYYPEMRKTYRFLQERFLQENGEGE